MIDNKLNVYSLFVMNEPWGYLLSSGWKTVGDVRDRRLATQPIRARWMRFTVMERRPFLAMNSNVSA